MRAAVHLAQEMGAQLGQREVLQQTMPQAQKRVIRYRVVCAMLRPLLESGHRVRVVTRDRSHCS